MAERIKTARDLQEACQKLVEELHGYRPNDRHEHWSYELLSFDERGFFASVRGTWRIAFKSRNRAFSLFGLGAADLIHGHELGHTMEQVTIKTKSLDKNQLYFGASRFDEYGEMAPEWQYFGKRLFILPLLLVIERDDKRVITLSYRTDGCFVWAKWLDDAVSLLKSLSNQMTRDESTTLVTMGGVVPPRHEFYENLDRALLAFQKNSTYRKVVLGRRRSIIFKNALDPVDLYFRLKTKAKDAFLFFLDNGNAQAFFGGSPELLYRRLGLNLETESLAGTRPRLLSASDDADMRDALRNSFKDQREHAFVCDHIREKLACFGITDLCVSTLQIMELPYALHLVKHYRGYVSPFITDARILTALHPSPAVCGSESEWAREFIRTHEGFDRGFYAGPIGYVGAHEAEFAVAIRSALLYEQELFIYAAGGIVLGSAHEQEWEELNNKEKNILSIFEEDLSVDSVYAAR